MCAWIDEIKTKVEAEDGPFFKNEIIFFKNISLYPDQD